MYKIIKIELEEKIRKVLNLESEDILEDIRQPEFSYGIQFTAKGLHYWLYQDPCYSETPIVLQCIETQKGYNL
jgi:hypothetical protein